MNMKFLKYLILSLFLTVTFNSLNAQKKYSEFKSIYNYQVECLGTGTKGVFVFKTIIVQRKKRPDYERLKKSAVFSVLFNGIPGVPSKGCITQNSLLDSDDYENNIKYFEDFFDNGKFSQFISLADQSNALVLKMKGGYQIAMTVTVRRDDLARKLEQDGIRKGLSSYFD